MAVSKTQPMRSAEIALIDEVNGYSGSISDIETAIGALQTAISTLQTDVDNAETAIGTLQTSVGNAETNISTLQTDVDNAESAITTLQTDVDNAESAITALQTDVGNLQSNFSNLNTLQTIDYSEYVIPTTGITINEATMRKLGKIAMLHVEFNCSETVAVNSQKSVFEVRGDYAPVAGAPASCNGNSYTSLLSKDKMFWIKTYSATFTGSHYIDCIFITAQ